VAAVAAAAVGAPRRLRAPEAPGVRSEPAVVRPSVRPAVALHLPPLVPALGAVFQAVPWVRPVRLVRPVAPVPVERLQRAARQPGAPQEVQEQQALPAQRVLRPVRVLQARLPGPAQRVAPGPKPTAGRQ
jgi:hypothetical protein